MANVGKYAMKLYIECLGIVEWDDQRYSNVFDGKKLQCLDVTFDFQPPGDFRREPQRAKIDVISAQFHFEQRSNAGVFAENIEMKFLLS